MQYFYQVVQRVCKKYKLQQLKFLRHHLILPNPDPLKLQDVEWIIITKDNAMEIFEKLKAAGGEYALFAVEDTGYEKIQVNYTDIRNKLAEQKQLLLAYKEYYESEEPEVTE